MCARVSSTTRSSCAAVVPGDRHLDQREVARDGRHVAQVLDLQHVDQLVEIGRDAIGARPGRCRCTIVMREMPGSSVRPTVSDSMLKARRRNNERHAIEHAGLVFDERDQRVMHIDS